MADSELLAYVLAVYEGSDGDATKALYAKLDERGPIGAIATNLFRAQKNSERAKGYRGRGHRGAAYDRKGWAIGNLAEILGQHAEGCSLPWGWGIDAKQPVHRHVLYVDLPTGQASFHAGERGAGPDYPGEWDGIPGQSPQRILRFVIRVLELPASAADLVVHLPRAAGELLQHLVQREAQERAASLARFADGYPAVVRQQRQQDLAHLQACLTAIEEAHRG